MLGADRRTHGGAVGASGGVTEHAAGVCRRLHEKGHLAARALRAGHHPAHPGCRLPHGTPGVRIHHCLALLPGVVTTRVLWFNLTVNLSYLNQKISFSKGLLKKFKRNSLNSECDKFSC